MKKDNLTRSRFLQKLFSSLLIYYTQKGGDCLSKNEDVLLNRGDFYWFKLSISEKGLSLHTR